MGAHVQRRRDPSPPGEVGVVRAARPSPGRAALLLAAGVLVETRVAQGDDEELGEGLAGRHVVEGEREGLLALEVEHAERLGALEKGDRIEALLEAAGFTLVPTREATLCCGSAGTYSILHPELSGELRRRKVAALTSGAPDMIATANIGCLEHLRGGGSPVPVRHWIELLADALDRHAKRVAWK